MLPHVLSKQRFDELIQFLMGRYRVVGPVAKPMGAVAGGGHSFEVIADPSQLDMGYPLTILPPKKYFFPQYETLLSYGKAPSGGHVEAPVQADPTVIVGMHPCDVYATWLLDDVFSRDESDPYYLSKRNRALIIGLDCAGPCDEHVFCQDMGSLYVDAGYDLMLSDLGDRYYVDVGSERGRELVETSGCFEPAAQTDHEKRAEHVRRKRESFSNKISYDTKYLPQILDESYDSLLWDAASRGCFSCGACSLVCPTCYCFDVTDEVEMDLQTGRRRRSWDSCMLKSFAEVAGGENFREHRSARLRHRVFRKGKYMLEMFGKLGCVGCGRCDRHCPAKISILQIYQQLAATPTTAAAR